MLAIVVGGPFGSLMGMNVMHSSNHGGMVGPNRPILSWVMEHSLDLVGGGSGPHLLSLFLLLLLLLLRLRLKGGNQPAHLPTSRGACTCAVEHHAYAEGEEGGLTVLTL